MINTSGDHWRTNQLCDSTYNIMKITQEARFIYSMFETFLFRGQNDIKSGRFCPLVTCLATYKVFEIIVLNKFDKVFSLLMLKLISPMIKMCGDSVCKEFSNSLKLLSNTK